MVVEIELPVHAHLAVERSCEERFVPRIFVHDSGERGTARRDESRMEADVVGEEVVGDLSTAFDGNGALVVVTAFMSSAPVVEVCRATHIEGALDAARRIVHRAEGRRVGKTTVGRFALNREVRVVVVLGEEGITA